MFDVIGSAARAVASQQDAPAPPVTFSAAFPYLSLTTAFSSSFAIAVASRLTSSSLDTSAQKRGQSQRLTTRSPDALGLMAATAASISAIASGSGAESIQRPWRR